MKTKKRKGSWIQTYTGRQFWPLDPRPEDVCIEDIAHSLSFQCRFSGHCLVPYTVSDHSYHVSLICNVKDALWGLMHDASEAYLVDLPRPIKRNSILGDEYSKIETKVMRVICKRFGLVQKMPQTVHFADDFLLCWEQRDLMAPPPVPWGTPVPVLPDKRLVPLSHKKAEEQFLKRFFELYTLGDK